jgi:hypothetical protein
VLYCDFPTGTDMFDKVAGRVGFHFSLRYFAVKTPFDDSRCHLCNQSDTRE